MHVLRERERQRQRERDREGDLMHVLQLTWLNLSSLWVYKRSRSTLSHLIKGSQAVISVRTWHNNPPKHRRNIPSPPRNVTSWPSFMQESLQTVHRCDILMVWLNVLKGCTTSLTFNNCTFWPHCIYVFCIYLRTNSDLCHLQHKLTGFYNRDEKCLQRGTDWGFK